MIKCNKFKGRKVLILKKKMMMKVRLKGNAFHDDDYGGSAKQSSSLSVQ